MILITSARRAVIGRQDQALDFEPVVKLFTPTGAPPGY
jgi:hypothetical protein